MRPPGGNDQAIFWVEVVHGEQHEDAPEWYDGIMLPDFGFCAGSGNQCLAAVVVNNLRINMFSATKNAKSRSSRSAFNSFTDTPSTFYSCQSFRFCRTHVFYPYKIERI